VLCSLLWVTLLGQGGWAGWPTEVPANPHHAGIRGFCDLCRDALLSPACQGSRQAAWLHTDGWGIIWRKRAAKFRAGTWKHSWWAG